MTETFFCKRCGTCCKKGGPALHEEDLKLIDNGVITYENLYTLRIGETVLDNVKNTLIMSESEIVKIKGTPCVFYDEAIAGCSIYASRPLECRALACWNTLSIETVYNSGRLSRRKAVRGDKILTSLIEAHASVCDYEEIARMTEAYKNGASDGEDLIEKTLIDGHMRDLTAEKAGLDPALLDFLYGRPVYVILKAHGIRVEKDSQKTFLKIHVAQTY